MNQEQVPQLPVDRLPGSIRPMDGAAYRIPGMIFRKAEIFILIPGLILIVGMLIFQQAFKPIVAGALDLLLWPLTTTLPFFIVVPILVGGVALAGMLIQKYYLDWDLMRNSRAKNMVLQDDFKEARRTGNEEKLKEVQMRRMATVGDATKMMKQQIKSMIYLLLISVPVFFWMFWYFNDHPQLSMVFPFWGAKAMVDTFIVFQFWILWSLVCSVSAGQVFRMLLNVRLEPLEKTTHLQAECPAVSLAKEKS